MTLFKTESKHRESIVESPIISNYKRMSLAGSLGSAFPKGTSRQKLDNELLNEDKTATSTVQQSGSSGSKYYHNASPYLHAYSNKVFNLSTFGLHARLKKLIGVEQTRIRDSSYLSSVIQKIEEESRENENVSEHIRQERERLRIRKLLVLCLIDPKDVRHDSDLWNEHMQREKRIALTHPDRLFGKKLIKKATRKQITVRRDSSIVLPCLKPSYINPAVSRPEPALKKMLFKPANHITTNLAETLRQITLDDDTVICDMPSILDEKQRNSKQPWHLDGNFEFNPNAKRYRFRNYKPAISINQLPNLLKLVEEETIQGLYDSAQDMVHLTLGCKHFSK